MTFVRSGLLAGAIILSSLNVAYAQTAESEPLNRDTLQTVLASVYNGNPQLLAERARLREVDESYVQARAQGRPSLSAAASATYQAQRSPDGQANLFNPNAGDWIDITPRNAQVSVMQPLYQGGRVRALKQQAKANIMASRAGLESAENSVFLSAATAYADVLRDEDAARIRRNNVRVLSRQLEAADARFEVGEGTRTDVAQSRARLAAAEAGLAQADAQLEVSRARFVRLVGRMPNQLSPIPAIVLPAELDEAIGLARDNSPQLLAAYYNEEAGEAAIDVAKAAGKPTLGLTGSLARSRGTFLGFSDADQVVIGAQLSVPIYSGGANQSRVRQAEHARTRLGFQTRDAERTVDETITQVWAQLDAARRTLAASQQQVEAARTAFEGVQLERDVGTRTQLDVLDAEQETLNAELSVLDARRAVDVATFQLLATIGVLDVDGLSLPLERYDASANFDDIKDDAYARHIESRLPDTLTFSSGEDVDTLTDTPADEP